MGLLRISEKRRDTNERRCTFAAGPSIRLPYPQNPTIVRRAAYESLFPAGFAAALICVLAATSCDTSLASEGASVDRIVLTPSSANVQAGATVTLTALVLDATGNAMRERKVVWASEVEAIAAVSQSGVVTGVAAGVVQVAASSGGRSASAAITVSPRPVTVVRITPGSATIPVTGSLTLQAEALDASGAPVLGRPVAWTSSNEAIAIVTSNGVVGGIAAGSVTITATVDGRAGTAAIAIAPQPVASVSVTPAADTTLEGRRVSFRATPFDAQNLPLANRMIAWTSDNPVVAVVSSTGEVLALAVGSARIKATVEGKFAEGTIVVQPVPVARVVVVPSSATVDLANTSQLTATAKDSAGNTLARTITWVSLTPSIASVDATGLVTANAVGSATIEARTNGAGVGGADVVGTSAITVNAAVNTVAVTSARGFIVPSDTMHLTVVLKDVLNQPLTGRPITFSSSATASATVDAAGVVTGGSSPGPVSITATSEGKTGTVNLNTVVGIAGMAVKGPGNGVATDTLLPRTTTKTYTVTVTDGGGNPLRGRVLAVSNGNPSALSISATNVTTDAAGQATVSATAGTKSGSSTITFSSVAREGAIPPGAPGTNTAARSIRLVVP